MFDLIKSCAILFIFVGSLFLVYSYAKTDDIKEQKVVIEKPYDVDPNNTPYPSVLYKDMFELPSIWMGRSDKESRVLIDLYKKQIIERIQTAQKEVENYNDLDNQEVNDILNENLDTNRDNINNNINTTLLQNITTVAPEGFSNIKVLSSV